MEKVRPMKVIPGNKEPPLIHASATLTWRHYYKQLQLWKDPMFPEPTLTDREVVIFVLGTIAGGERERGVWDVPEGTKPKTRKGRHHGRR